MKDPLPVPDQLEKQLAKCKTVRDADTYFSLREKTKEVSVRNRRRWECMAFCSALGSRASRRGDDGGWSFSDMQCGHRFLEAPSCHKRIDGGSIGTFVSW